MAMVDLNDSCQLSADSQPKSIGLVWGLASTRRSVYIHQMNRVNSRNNFGDDDSTKTIVMAIIIIIIIIIIIGVVDRECYGDALDAALLKYVEMSLVDVQNYRHNNMRCYEIPSDDANRYQVVTVFCAAFVF